MSLGRSTAVCENNYASVQSISFFQYIYFQHLITLLIIKHIIAIICIKGRFIITLLSLTLTIIYNGKVIKHSSEYDS